MYAIIATGGKQYKVSEGDKVRVEKLGLAEGEDVTFDKVLMISEDGNIKVGDPYLKNATVTAKVAGDGKGKKVVIFKYKAKKGYARPPVAEPEFDEEIKKGELTKKVALEQARRNIAFGTGWTEMEKKKLLNNLAIKYMESDKIEDDK
jgi:large subunit ribosomal protein L21